MLFIPPYIDISLLQLVGVFTAQLSDIFRTKSNICNADF